MEKLKYKISFYIILLIIIIGLLSYFYIYQNLLVNSNFFIAIVTLIVGGIAVYLYGTQKRDAKIDAAKIILQEIRRAEDVIAKYKEQGNFQFTQKIIANNSWGKNIHYFVNDLTQDELDKISNTYSVGEFLDKVIYRVYEWQFDYQSDVFYERAPKIKMAFSDPSNPSNTQIKEVLKPADSFWNILLKDVVTKYEPIYHSTIVDPLKKIAKLKN